MADITDRLPNAWFSFSAAQMQRCMKKLPRWLKKRCSTALHSGMLLPMSVLLVEDSELFPAIEIEVPPLSRQHGKSCLLHNIR